MTKILALLGTLFVLLAGADAGADPTAISQVPVLNIEGTGSVRPNLMLLYDNSGSMTYTFTPDYIDDTTTCRKYALMKGATSSISGTQGCVAGHPPFNSSDFNRQYYDPAVRYTPPVYADGTSYASMTRTRTTDWTSVPTDGFGINKRDLLGVANDNTDLVHGFPDLRWCDSGGANCVTNTATYTYPNDSRYKADPILGNPYYYKINVAEYCFDATLTSCKTTAAGAAAPANYPVPAKVRWCSDTSLASCQAKYTSDHKYPRFSNPALAVGTAYATIAIGASATTKSLAINSISVGEPTGAVTITNAAVTASTGTTTAADQRTVATALAASIIARRGLANPYLACVKTPAPTPSSVPACSAYGIALGADNVVAVIPVACAAGTSGKTIGDCPIVTDGSRAGWALSADVSSVKTENSTAMITVSGSASASSNSKTTLQSSTTLGRTAVLSSNLTFATNATSSAQVAAAIAKAIGSVGTIKAILGGDTGASTPTVCKGMTNTTVCLVDSAATAGGTTISMGRLVNNPTRGGLGWTLTPSTGAIYDSIPLVTTPLGTGGAVFVRTDIVSTVNSYPRAEQRTDCAAATCTYDEEMTNFANWYAYYKTRNQMMKTAVGHAFQALNSNYNVGVVSLSTAAAGGTIANLPAQFSDTNRGSWYTALYAMNGDQSTPTRKGLHAVGKMFANQYPYIAPPGKEVVQYPCQQNFVFITTDGYWNGDPATYWSGDPDGRGAVYPLNNDNKENPNRFCSLATGCLDTRDQDPASLADVALYWYNGGSNSGTASLRKAIDDVSKNGQVPAKDGENTHLHMNTYALGLGVDGIMNYEPKYDTAAAQGGDFYNLTHGVRTGCQWNDNGPYVWPDPATANASGSAALQSRVDDLWHAAINGHGRYFSASDPNQVVEGLSSALSAIQVRVGAASAAATSTPNISQEDNAIFSSTFTTVRWYGELSARTIDPVTGEVSADATWTTSDMLGRKVGPDDGDRKIWMIDTDKGGQKEFRYANLNPTEAAWFDKKCLQLAQCNSLNAVNRAVVDSGANIVAWLRGAQRYADGAILRDYTATKDAPTGLTAPIPIVLGDIASSKPAYLRDPRKSYTAAGYDAFRTKWAQRDPVVFVAANDGMLHAFDAGDGHERWAYAPRITMKKLFMQASTTYGTNHQFTTDGAPEVGDVYFNGAWHSVLVAGLNAGGRGYYALDVTDPNAAPTVLWEFCADSTVCANSDDDLGLSFGNPQFGTWKDGKGGAEKWVVFLTSGYNNVTGTDGVKTGSGKGYLYVIDVATGARLAKIDTGAGDGVTPSGFSRITAITANPAADPLVTYVYGGDNLGRMYRFDFTAGGANPPLVMADAGSKQPVTTRPEVTLCAMDVKDADGTVSKAAHPVVVFGSGRLLDSSDLENTDTQSVYVLKDSATGIARAAGSADWRSAAGLAAMTSTANGKTGTFSINGVPVDWATQPGWYFDLSSKTGERVNIDPKVVSGTLNVVTNLPTSSTVCSVGGTSNLYQLDVCTAAQLMTTVVSVDRNGNIVTDGTGTGTKTIAIAGRPLSNSSAAVGFIVVRLPDGTLKLIATTADGKNTPFDMPSSAAQDARKAGWRRVRD